jgi:hypothetical protein
MKKVIVTMIAVMVAFMKISAPNSAHADYYAGGDWGGRDLVLLNGDSLSGDFYNVGKLYVPTGANIFGGTGNLVINAGSILIDGNLTGLPVPAYDLKLSSKNDLLLNGSLSSWESIWLSANQITVTGTVSVLDGRALDGTVRPIVSPNDPNGATLSISVVPTPIPAAAWLFGSGLLWLAGIRRKMQQA